LTHSLIKSVLDLASTFLIQTLRQVGRQYFVKRAIHLEILYDLRQFFDFFKPSSVLAASGVPNSVTERCLGLLSVIDGGIVKTVLA
jgi:hypothetical protein